MSDAAVPTYVTTADLQRAVSEVETAAAFKQAAIRLNSAQQLLRLALTEINQTPILIGDEALRKAAHALGEGGQILHGLLKVAQEHS